jgi:hypothetical protein
MSLQDEIEKNSKEILSESYSMSVGEVISLYKDKEIDIHPEFQRFFRWNPSQKSKLIESLLLGIPIPSLFVSQRDDGVWDIIDGVQRLSTILEYVGILRDETKKVLPASVLTATKYLPSLEGKAWENEEDPNERDPKRALSGAQRMFLKRAKLDFKIIKKESSPEAKYELFQRINTLGTNLSDQEIRNCLLIMANRHFFHWLKTLSTYEPYRISLQLSERNQQEQYDMEIVLRLLTYETLSDQHLKNVQEVGEFITEKMLELASDEKFPYDAVEQKFKKTFELLGLALGDNVFRKYENRGDTFRGPFLISAFEVIGVGLYHNIDKYQPSDKQLIAAKVKSIYENKIFANNSGMGIRASSRAPRLIPFGRRLFSEKAEE